MSLATAIHVNAQCSNCAESLESHAKFCGHCGFIVASATNIFEQQRRVEHLAAGEADQGAAPSRVPSFATSGIPVENEATRKMIGEANKLLLLLARERLFLIMHWAIFIVVNLAGCWMGWKCYAEFCGDEMSKLMVASTPFLFINSMSLLSLPPIKGTRHQIAILKERIQYLRFNIEFGHLNLKELLK